MSLKKTDIIDKINKLFQHDGVRLEARPIDDGDFQIGEILFSKKAHILNVKDHEGLILKQPSEELKNTLQQRGISYVDHEGNLFLNTKHGKIILNPEKPKIGYKPSYLKLKEVNVLNPTNLISPIGLSLVDTLFRINDIELEKIQSVLKFCKLYNLPQPKVNLTMKRLKAKSLSELKNRIKNIPLEWWLFGLESSHIRRKMINFFDIATPYHSLMDDPPANHSSYANKVNEIEERFHSVAPGPTEVAKKLNLIIDRDISLWTSTSVDSKLKKEYKLIPGTKEGYKTWMIATVSDDVLNNFIITHHKGTENYIKTNFVRTIWDLSYGESRLREIREKMLRMFIYESGPIKIFELD